MDIVIVIGVTSTGAVIDPAVVIVIIVTIFAAIIITAAVVNVDVIPRWPETLTRIEVQAPSLPNRLCQTSRPLCARDCARQSGRRDAPGTAK
eukprot:2908933-Pyramimonas_sp.AAC.1